MKQRTAELSLEDAVARCRALQSEHDELDARYEVLTTECARMRSRLMELESGLLVEARQAVVDAVMGAVS